MLVRGAKCEEQDFIAEEGVGLAKAIEAVDSHRLGRITGVIGSASSLYHMQILIDLGGKRSLTFAKIPKLQVLHPNHCLLSQVIVINPNQFR